MLLAATGEPPAGLRLADALVPAIDDATGVAAADVQRLLGAIGLGESDAPVWVSGGGRFRHGVLRGAWHKPAAAFIGHSAREAARQARLAELRDRADAARAEVVALEQELAELTRRHAQLERELTALPPETAVRDADSALAAVEAELAALARRLDDARGREQQAQDVELEAGDILRADAADLGLPPGGEELVDVEAALGRLRELLAALWPARDRCRRAEQARGRADRDVHAAGSEHAETAGRLTDAEHQLAAAVERRDTLQSTAGAAIAELDRRLAEVAGALAANQAAQRETEERLGEAQRADGAAEALSGELRQQVEARHRIAAGRRRAAA